VPSKQEQCRIKDPTIQWIIYICAASRKLRFCSRSHTLFHPLVMPSASQGRVSAFSPTGKIFRQGIEISPAGIRWKTRRRGNVTARGNPVASRSRSCRLRETLCVTQSNALAAPTRAAFLRCLRFIPPRLSRRILMRSQVCSGAFGSFFGVSGCHADAFGASFLFFPPETSARRFADQRASSRAEPLTGRSC